MPQHRQRRYLICRCDVVYERRLEFLGRHASGRFTCPCGTHVGAWNGIIRLIYRPVCAPDDGILKVARRVVT